MGGVPEEDLKRSWMPLQMILFIEGRETEPECVHWLLRLNSRSKFGFLEAGKLEVGEKDNASE